MEKNINSLKEYNEAYEKSISNPEEFWEAKAKKFIWHKKWNKVLTWDFNKPEIRWFEGGKLNITENCLDRNLQEKGGQIAIKWIANNPNEANQTLTYNELFNKVCLFANVLKKNGAQKGDRICLYMPMVPELAIAVLACARIGAIHSVVFAGFSAKSLSDRINDANCNILITADGGFRGDKITPLKDIADEAMKNTPSIQKCIVLERAKSNIKMQKNRDVWWHDEIKKSNMSCPAESMDSEDPLFILYTSGSTGKPKGIQHSIAGYMIYTEFSFRNVFQYKTGDLYWCTADIGWITGHSYIIYGPLLAGATSMMFEGIPSFPDYSRFWQIIEENKVNIFYTAPTAIRALMREGDGPVKKTSRKSLKLLGTVGEPINPEAWMWYFKTVGNSKCPIVDTWWQTETGGILIAPQTGAIPLKPGSATKPFYGIKPVLVDKDGKEIKGQGEGRLCIAQSWPGQMRTVYGDHQRFFDTYFSRFPGKYFSGDGCKRDEDGYYWITGRVDDVIIVSGHNLGTAEIEGSIGGHPDVAEAAVVGYPHEIKGNSIYAFVTLRTGREITEDTKSEIAKIVRADIGPHATPEKIQFTEGLPKTRSGKIMRRILRSIASGNIDDLGDISTLADPSVVESLVNDRI